MSEPDTDLPANWFEVPGSEQQESVLLEYQYRTEADTELFVAVLRPASNASLYKLRLSTVTPQTHSVRHDYPVAHYETQEKARENAIAFVNYLSDQIEEGEITPKHPKIENIRRVIADFSSNGFFPMFHGISRKLSR